MKGMTHIELDNGFSLDEKYQWQKKYCMALDIRGGHARLAVESYANTRGWDTQWAYANSRLSDNLDSDPRYQFVAEISCNDIPGFDQFDIPPVTATRCAYVSFKDPNDRHTDVLVPLLIRYHRLRMKLALAVHVRHWLYNRLQTRALQTQALRWENDTA